MIGYTQGDGLICMISFTQVIHKGTILHSTLGDKLMCMIWYIYNYSIRSETHVKFECQSNAGGGGVGGGFMLDQN